MSEIPSLGEIRRTITIELARVAPSWNSSTLSRSRRRSFVPAFQLGEHPEPVQQHLGNGQNVLVSRGRWMDPLGSVKAYWEVSPGNHCESPNLTF